MNDLILSRLNQAKGSLDEAKALLEAGMDQGIALTNLYYAIYYPVIALVYEGKVPDTMQSVTLGLFDQRFAGTGLFKKEHADAIRQIFDIKPKCSGSCPPLSRERIEDLLRLAEEFIESVEIYCGRDK